MSRPALELWDAQIALPGMPLFSGGVMDAWPAWAVDALAICHAESAAIRVLHLHDAKRRR